jgi:hypothetical protein
MSRVRLCVWARVIEHGSMFDERPSAQVDVGNAEGEMKRPPLDGPPASPVSTASPRPQPSRHGATATNGRGRRPTHRPPRRSRVVRKPSLGVEIVPLSTCYRRVNTSLCGALPDRVPGDETRCRIIRRRWPMRLATSTTGRTSLRKMVHAVVPVGAQGRPVNPRLVARDRS